MTFLTNTTSWSSSGAIKISYDASADQSKQNFTFEYPTAATGYRVSVATIPQGSKFHPGAHWHEDYDEYMRVIKGRAKIRLGDTWRVITPEDGEVLIPKGVIHDITRADADAKPGEEDEGDLVVEERGDPGTLPTDQRMLTRMFLRVSMRTSADAKCDSRRLQGTFLPPCVLAGP